MELTNIIDHIIDIKMLDKNSIVVDAGACIGEFSDGLKKFIDCRIISIEPVKSNIEILKNKNVEIIEKALVGRSCPEEMTIYCFRTRKGNTLYPIRRRYIENYRVKTITLDDIFKMTNKIDYLKLDVEGAEKDILETMTIEDSKKIRQIAVESHYNASLEYLAKMLRNLQYELKVITHREIYGVQKL